VPARLTRARLAHPEWWVYALAACAWAAVLLTHVTAGHAHHHHDEHGSPLFSTGAAVFLLMVAAMMLPFAAPAARHVAKASFWTRRQRAAACYVLGFAAVWASFGLALFAARAAVPLPGVGAGWLAATAAGAGFWQGSRRRRRAAARCGNRPALPQRGRQATSQTVRAGGAFGMRCIPLCGPAMAIMAVSPQLVVMLAAFGIQAYEWRRGPNPFARRRWREPALAYAAMATLAAVVAAA
jgi:Predicted metal-binding integral membrane protein (DUF2182)